MFFGRKNTPRNSCISIHVRHVQKRGFSDSLWVVRLAHFAIFLFATLKEPDLEGVNVLSENVDFLFPTKHPDFSAYIRRLIQSTNGVLSRCAGCLSAIAVGEADVFVLESNASSAANSH